MANPLAALEGEKYMSLETFKRDGTGVKTPVWFAHHEDSLVFYTDSRSWKVKRLRRDPRARVAACSVRGKVHGPWYEATCTRLEGPEAEAAIGALTAKYSIGMRVGNALAALAGRKKYRACYRIDF